MGSYFKNSKTPDFRFPHSHPPPLSRPAGRKRGAFNSPFGRVFKMDEFYATANMGKLGWGVSGRCRGPTRLRSGPVAAMPPHPTPLCPNARLSVYVSCLNTRPNGLFRLLFLARRGEKEAGEIEWGKKTHRPQRPLEIGKEKWLLRKHYGRNKLSNN